jgi:hypothetical protein
MPRIQDYHLKNLELSVKINCAKPSATAVLPTPGSPIKNRVIFL